MKRLLNSYVLPNKDQRLSAEEIRRCLSDFEYFMGNYAQVTNKQRQIVPFRLNEFQKLLFKTLLPMVKKETRLNKRHHVVVCKPRQCGASVSVVGLINYICAFVDGMTNLSIVHVFPVGDTISKFYNKKVTPIVTGVHPDLMPTIERETLSTSILTHYKDIKGMRRNNYYELVSSSASSIRSDSVHWVIEDEISFYAHPEALDDAVMPALPDYGFSLVTYLSTFDDRKSDYFQKKIITALENPEDWTLIFAPWYLVYPEQPMGVKLEDLELTKYDVEVILPSMKNNEVPKERWGDCIDWYHRKSLSIPNMKKEYPTTIEEVLEMGQNKCVFSQEALDFQKQNVEPGTSYRFITDNQTGKVEAQETEASPFKIYRKPLYGHKYILTIDPIMSTSDDSDMFAASMFDQESLEQVATFRTNGLDIEDYADYMVSMAKLYNRAIICPERNIAEALVAMIRANGYYNFYYEGNKAKGNRDPGIRTTVSSKEGMLDKLNILLNSKRVILHDKVWIDELGWFERRVKKRNDGTELVRMCAKPGKKDDTVASLWILAGSLDQQQLTGQKKSGFAVI